jgi:hypothetical protein
MFDQSIGQQASQLANAIENNDLNGAAQMLQNDVQGVTADSARALIRQTNQYTQQDGYRDNTTYDQLRPDGLNYAGLPVVEFVNGQNQVDASVGLSNIIPENQQYQAPQYQGDQYQSNQGYYAQQGDGCGGATLGGATAGAAAGMLLDRRNPLAAGLMALGIGALANKECERR